MTSSPNTRSGQRGKTPANKPATLAAFFETDDEDPEKDEALDSLSKQLESAKDARREERFLWIVVCVILVDVIWFRNAPNPTMPVVILLLEAIVLIVLAKRLGVEDISELIQRTVQGLTRGNGG